MRYLIIMMLALLGSTAMLTGCEETDVDDRVESTAEDLSE